MDFLKLVAEHPESLSVMAISSVMALFFVASIWNNIAHMSASMVTKKDLDIAIANLKIELADIYVSRRDCDIIERRKLLNGYGNGGIKT